MHVTPQNKSSVTPIWGGVANLLGVGLLCGAFYYVGGYAAAWLAAAVLADVTVEKVIALHVTTKQKLIGVHVVSIGTLDASLVHPREVFKAALLTNAVGLILAHNHPSGDPTPRPDDRTLVSRLRQVGSACPSAASSRNSFFHRSQARRPSAQRTKSAIKMTMGMGTPSSKRRMERIGTVSLL